MLNNLYQESPLFDVNDVQQILNISKSKAYQIIKKLNAELEVDGYITISGKVSRKYFMERIAL